MTALAHEEAPRAAWRDRELRLGPVALSLPAVVGLLVLFVAPLVTFFVYSFLTAGLFAVSGPATLENYEDVVTSSVNGTLALNSFYVGLCTAAVTVLLALPIAYWLRYCAGRRSNLEHGRTWRRCPARPSGQSLCSLRFGQ